MFTVLGNRSFMRNNAQAFDQAPLVNEYRKEEEKIIMNVKCVPWSSVAKYVSSIRSHTVINWRWMTIPYLNWKRELRCMEMRTRIRITNILNSICVLPLAFVSLLTWQLHGSGKFCELTLHQLPYKPNLLLVRSGLCFPTCLPRDIRYGDCWKPHRVSSTAMVSGNIKATKPFCQWD